MRSPVTFGMASRLHLHNIHMSNKIKMKPTNMILNQVDLWFHCDLIGRCNLSMAQVAVHCPGRSVSSRATGESKGLVFLRWHWPQNRGLVWRLPFNIRPHMITTTASPTSTLLSWKLQMVHLHFVSSFLATLSVFSGPLFPVSETCQTNSWVEGCISKADPWTFQTWKFYESPSISPNLITKKIKIKK